MNSIYVSDVGDGLCFAGHTIFGKTIQFDCGSSNKISGGKMAFDGLQRIIKNYHNPEVFILSHFHIDHYNGLLYASDKNQKTRPLQIKEVYFPRLPEFKEKEQFLLCLFTINARVFGHESGIMEYDFLQTLKRINSVSFKARRVSRGEKYQYHYKDNIVT